MLRLNGRRDRRLPLRQRSPACTLAPAPVRGVCCRNGNARLVCAPAPAPVRGVCCRNGNDRLPPVRGARACPWRPRLSVAPVAATATIARACPWRPRLSVAPVAATATIARSVPRRPRLSVASVAVTATIACPPSVAPAPLRGAGCRCGNDRPPAPRRPRLSVAPAAATATIARERGAALERTT